MSAFIVGKAHIDALVTAAAAVDRYEHMSGMTWWDEPDPELRSLTFAEIDAKRREIHHNDRTRASEVGMMLWAENMASIHARYPDTAEKDGDYPGPVDFSEATALGYRYQPTASLPPETILSALACYEYQSCEHDGWRTSEARAFCDALRDKMIRQLDGYRSAPWELDENDVRPKAGAVV